MPARIVILGAAGRDFHNFNVVCRDDPGVQVVAFTQAQIPRLRDRRYPASLAGPRYPAGIPIEDEARYPHIGPVLPAVGYDAGQLQELRETIDRSAADVVVAATPLDLAALIALEKPVVRAHYEFEDAGEPTLGSLVDAFLARGTERWHNESGARERR